MARPTLSVIIWQFRRRGYLAGALESVLTPLASRSDVEVVLALGEPDPEVAQLVERAGGRVRRVDPPEPTLGRMMERAIRATSGEVLLFLDDDDRFLPGKVARVEEIFASDPELGFYHHEVDFMDSDGRAVGAPGFRASIRARMPPGRTVYLPAQQKLRQLGRLADVGPDFNSSSMVVRRRAIEPYLEAMATIEAGNDAFLFFAAALAAPGSVRCDGDRWGVYRLHGQSASRYEGAAPDPRPALAAVSRRFAEAQESLVRVASADGRPVLIRTAKAIVECHRFFEALRSPTPSRRTWGTAFFRVLPYWSTFPMRTNWNALLGSTGMFVAPGLVQRMYLRRVLAPLTPVGPSARPGSQG